MGMEISEDTEKFIHYIGASSVMTEYSARAMAREIAPFLGKRGNVKDWVKVLYNPKLRASALGTLIWLHRSDTNLDWAILFSDLESKIDSNIKDVIRKKASELMEQNGEPVKQFSVTLTWVFKLIGRDTTNYLAAELMKYIAKYKKTVWKGVTALATA